MRCQSICILEREDDELDLESFLKQLRRCDGCPHASDAGDPVLRRTLVRLRAAARSSRRKSATIRKLAHEQRELQVEIDRYESQITKLERVQVVSSEEIEAALRDQVERVLEQEREIEALSVPLIHIWDGVLVLPIIGAMSTTRAEILTTRLLDEVSARQLHTAIVDVTGVAQIDTHTANNIVNMMRALRLLGTRTLLTGVTPTIAQTLVGLGVELADVETLRNVRQALRAVMFDPRR